MSMPKMDRESDRLLLLLITTDIVFILLHCFYRLDIISNPLFSIEKNFGYAEVFQYIKELWIALLLLIYAKIYKYHIYTAWAMLFTYFLLDDALEIHEKYGLYISRYFDFIPMFNLRAEDFGELCISFIFGLTIFSLIAKTYLSTDREAKIFSRGLFILVMLLAFFGIFVDMLHIAIPWKKSIWGLIEDGGEMLVMSFILIYVFNLDKRDITPIPKSPL
jgi:hypothetical protein